MVIKVLLELWRPKMQVRYITKDYANEIDEVVFDFQQYGKTVYRPIKAWEEGSLTYRIKLNDE